MTIQEAIELNLVYIHIEDNTEWLIETATGEKITTVSENDKAIISFNEKGIVTAIFL